MTVKTLNTEQKAILKELLKADDLRSVKRDAYDRPINKPVNATNGNSALSAFRKCADNNHFSWLLRENLLDRFKEFATSKQLNDNIISPDEKEFDEAAYNADMEAHAVALSEEQQFLTYAKQNPGMYAFADVTNHVRRFQSLRTNFPSRNDAKYTKDKILTLTRTGTELLERFVQLDTLRNEIITRHTAKQLAAWHESHDLTLDEKSFKLLKQLWNLGQIDVDKIPVECIKENCHRWDIRNALEDALRNHASIAAYNSDEHAFSASITDAEAEFTAAFEENDAYILNSLAAIIDEFQNLVKIENTLAEVTNV